jgi:hypothetical protein
MAEEKSKWFGKCSLCGIEKDLTTIQVSLPKIYSLWLKRMCEECRNKTLFYFYEGLGFGSTAKIWKKKNG